MAEEMQKRHIASYCGLASAVAAGGLTVLFSLSNSWVRTRVLATIALYILAIPFFEFGNNGRWFPQLSAPKSVLRGLLRGVIGIAGLTLLLSAFGLSLAMGSEKWKWTTVGFIFGMCGTSLLLIRSAITGTWGR